MDDQGCCNEKKLNREFYDRDTQIVAKALLGKYLVHHKNDVNYVGKIVEVEAYLGPHDLAAHSRRGVTPRTKVMFGAPGYVYVYLIYGIHYCLNVVTEKEGHGAAVLIRAIEPVANIDMRTNGPGLLCKAMKIDKTLNAHDLLSDEFYLTEGPVTPFTIVKKSRIGVGYAGIWADKLLRFYIKDNPYVSKK